MLKFTPIQLKKIPKYLFYITQNSQSNNQVRISAINMQKGKLAGTLEAFPQMISRDESSLLTGNNSKEYKSLYIQRIFSYERGKGIGSNLIKLARKLSEKYGCNGNIHLSADYCYDRENPPYIFYRKLGFNFANTKKEFANYVDKCIKSGKQFDSREMPLEEVRMYLLS